ncbi:MAG: cell division protein FtsA [Candidatus Omnitrophica bacterium]|nr:cell division protein FtsA [Candidatus Omnitrophota bacterium]
MLNNYICALDIGSDKLACVVAEIKKRRINKIFFESIPCKGVRSGIIIDSIALLDRVSSLVNSLRNKSGIKIKFLSTNISGEDILTKHSRAIVPLAERGNKVITGSDIKKVKEEARILGSSLEEEIIHSVASSYTIDSKANIINPLGLYSHRLEVDLYLVCAKLSSVQSLSRTVNQAGFEIKDLFFSGLATSRAVFDKELKEGLNIFCDIGSDITELLIFKDGALKDIEILPIGGNDFTSKLADTLKIASELAEDIKRSYGIIGDFEKIGEDKEILVKKSDFYKPIKQRVVAEIMTSEAKEFSAKIKDAIEKKVSCYQVDNFVVVGRAVLLEGFIETLENALAIPVRLGRIANPQILFLQKEHSDLSGQKFLTYLTCLGMICQILEEKRTGILPVHQPAKNLIKNTFNRVKEVYQEYF